MRYSEPRFTKDLDIFQKFMGTPRVPGAMYGVPVQFISLPDLIVNKRAAGRTSDLEHLKLLDTE